MTEPEADTPQIPIDTPAYRVNRKIPVEQLEALLAPLGLKRVKGFALANFEGQLRGRRVRVGCAMRSRHQYIGIGDASVRTFQGWMMTLTVDANIGTRLVLSARKPAGWTRPLLAWRKLRSVGELPGGLFANANEPDWAQEVLGRIAAEPVQQLFEGGVKADRTLGIGPFNATMTMSITDFHDVEEKLGGWMENMIDLVTLAESHRPKNFATPTRMERMSEEDPKKAAIVTAMTLLFGIPAVLLFLVVVIAGLLLWIGGPTLLMVCLILFAAIFMPIAMAIALWRYISKMQSRRKP